MDTERVASSLGIAGCIALLLIVLVPYALVSDPSALGRYYTAGPVGVGALAFMALLEVVVLLAGRRGRTDPETAAGIGFVVGLAMLAVATLWAVSIDPNRLFSFPPSDAWIEYHRWVVLGAAAVVSVGAASYARSVVGV
ncbi:MAG: hypothetical protein ABEJ28_09115 [Salinigranum sp.]